MTGTPGEQACPLCGSPVPASPRYPRQLCPACVRAAADAAGRPLRFQNASLSGGFAAFHADDDSPYDSHECFVRGVRCRADERHFGGIVIQTVDPAPEHND